MEPSWLRVFELDAGVHFCTPDLPLKRRVKSLRVHGLSGGIREPPESELRREDHDDPVLRVAAREHEKQDSDNRDDDEDVPHHAKEIEKVHTHSLI